MEWKDLKEDDIVDFTFNDYDTVVRVIAIIDCIDHDSAHFKADLYCDTPDCYTPGTSNVTLDDLSPEFKYLGTRRIIEKTNPELFV